MDFLNRENLKQLASVAVPVVLTQLGLMLLGVVDTWIIGRVGPEQLAGVAAGTNAFWPIAVIGFGILMGLDTVVSQAFGAKKYRYCRGLLAQGFYLGLILSVVLTAIEYLVYTYYDRFGASPEIVQTVHEYLKWTIWSMPATILFAALQRYWYGLQKVLPVLAILLIANIIHFFLGYALVLGKWGFPALEVRGLAIATLASRWWMFFALAFYTLVQFKKQTLVFFMGKNLRWKFKKWDLAQQKDILRIGIPSGGHFALEVGVFGFVTFVATYLGPVALGAHHIVLMFISMTFMVPMGISTAATVMVGFHFGAGRFAEAKRAGNICILASVIFMAVMSLMMVLYKEALMSWFTDNPPIVAIGANLFLLAALFQVADGAQITTAGVFKGIGNAKTPMLANFLGYYFFGLPLSLVLCFFYHWNVQGLWVGFTAGLFFIACFLLWRWIFFSANQLRHLPK